MLQRNFNSLLGNKLLIAIIDEFVKKNNIHIMRMVLIWLSKIFTEQIVNWKFLFYLSIL